MIRFYFILMLLVCAPGMQLKLHAQTEVRGVVRDAETNEPVPFVNIAMEGGDGGTTSDLDGRFSLKIESATGNLLFSSVGYEKQTFPLAGYDGKLLNIRMQPASISLSEVEIVADKNRENPAHPIIRKLWENKDRNNPEKLEAYEYEVYNKVEFDLNQLSEKFVNRKVFKPFRFIFDYIDSSDANPYLPIFISESISDYYYRTSPRMKKEVIRATKISGLDNESVTQFLGSMYQNINVYDNNIRIFGKSFVSPASTGGLIFYKYYLIDSLSVDGVPCYHLQFFPRRTMEPLFTGDIWISKGDYAVKRVNARMAGEVNINFVRGFFFEQTYTEPEEGSWILEKDKLLVDFSIGEESMGMYGKKTSSFKGYTLNKPRDPSFFNPAKPVEIQDGHRDHGEEFWTGARHVELEQTEQAVYTMVDSLKNTPAFNTYLDILQFIFTGYQEVGLFEFGPYSKLFSNNPVEGYRFRLGVRTSNKFSTRLALETFAAYGLRDEKWKYGGTVLYFISKDPRSIIGGGYSRDVVQLGQSPNAFDQDNVFSSVFRRNPASKLTLEEDLYGYYWHEWVPGFSNRLEYRTRQLSALGDLVYIRASDQENTADTLGSIRSTEATFSTRLAYRERFVSGEFDRVSLGSKYPVFEANLIIGLRDWNGGQFDYQKLELALSDDVSLGLLGNLYWRAEAGKTWGKAPYPLQEIHTGNETFFQDDRAFNTMNFFEFVSDEYVEALATHHFEGLFLNHIPLLKKLKWREVVSAKAVWGRFNREKNNRFILPEYIHTLEQKPFAEASVGIENIFKFLRIDALWRLSYLDNDNIVKFGIRGKLQLSF